MKRWQLIPAKAIRFGTEQLYAATIVYEETNVPIDAKFYCSNPSILNQIVLEHNKLVALFEASKRSTK
jgi:hypothetical protein